MVDDEGYMNPDEFKRLEQANKEKIEKYQEEHGEALKKYGWKLKKSWQDTFQYFMLWLLLIVVFLVIMGFGVFNDKFKSVVSVSANPNVNVSCPVLTCPNISFPEIPPCPSLACANTSINFPNNLTIIMRNST